jgi:hypothetical protein
VAAYVIVLVIAVAFLVALLLYGRHGPRDSSTTPSARSGGFRTFLMHYDFDFEVGSLEKHLVGFHWGQWWGWAIIKVDGVEVDRERHNFGASLTRNYEVSVGAAELHAVRIEKTRKRFFSGYRRQTFKAFVDEELIGEY